MDSGFLIQFQGGLTLQEKTLLSQIFPQTQELLKITPQDQEEILGRRLQRSTWNLRDRWSEAARSWEYLEKNSIKTLKWEDLSYPAQLKEIYDPPFRIYYRGERPAWDAPLLGLVGTRQPTEKAKKLAFELGKQSGEAGIWTVSGLARGIDEAVHRGTLEGGGKTLAVLACGLDQVYPKSNSALARRILEDRGCLLSEYPPLTPPYKYHFPQRNRIISGLSRGVVLVQAPVKSGALITTSLALEQGRDVFVCPEGFHPLVGSGGERLEQDGAVSIHSVRQILDNWDRLETREKISPYGGRQWTA